MDSEAFTVQKMGNRLIIGIPKRLQKNFRPGEKVFVDKVKLVRASEMAKKDNR